MRKSRTKKKIILTFSKINTKPQNSQNYKQTFSNKNFFQISKSNLNEKKNENEKYNSQNFLRITKIPENSSNFNKNFQNEKKNYKSLRKIPNLNYISKRVIFPKNEKKTKNFFEEKKYIFSKSKSNVNFNNTIFNRKISIDDNLNKKNKNERIFYKSFTNRRNLQIEKKIENLKISKGGPKEISKGVPKEKTRNMFNFKILLKLKKAKKSSNSEIFSEAETIKNLKNSKNSKKLENLKKELENSKTSNYLKEEKIMKLQMDLKILKIEKTGIRETLQEFIEKLQIYKRNIKNKNFTICELEKEIENLQKKNEENKILKISDLKEKEEKNKNLEILLLQNNFLKRKFSIISNIHQEFPFRKLSQISEDFFNLSKIDIDSVSLKKSFLSKSEKNFISKNESKSSLGKNFRKLAEKKKVGNLKNFLLGQIKNCEEKKKNEENLENENEYYGDFSGFDEKFEKKSFEKKSKKLKKNNYFVEDDNNSDTLNLKMSNFWKNNEKKKKNFFKEEFNKNEFKKKIIRNKSTDLKRNFGKGRKSLNNNFKENNDEVLLSIIKTLKKKNKNLKKKFFDQKKNK